MTERLHFHFSLSCIGEGNGNPLQCSCLENPRDGGAWWAAIYGVAQSRTRLKRLSSSLLWGLLCRMFRSILGPQMHYLPLPPLQVWKPSISRHCQTSPGEGGACKIAPLVKNHCSRLFFEKERKVKDFRSGLVEIAQLGDCIASPRMKKGMFWGSRNQASPSGRNWR